MVKSRHERDQKEKSQKNHEKTSDDSNGGSFCSFSGGESYAGEGVSVVQRQYGDEDVSGAY